jgi:hypothetical protein
MASRRFGGKMALPQMPTGRLHSGDPAASRQPTKPLKGSVFCGIAAIHTHISRWIFDGTEKRGGQQAIGGIDLADS